MKTLFMAIIVALLAIGGVSAQAQKPAAEEAVRRAETAPAENQYAADSLETAFLLRFDSLRMERRRVDNRRAERLRLPVWSSSGVPWYDGFQTELPFGANAVRSMTTSVLLHQPLPAHIVVFDEQTLMRLGHGSIGISNGQAQNFPGGHLDARTLSFPGRR